MIFSLLPVPLVLISTVYYYRAVQNQDLNQIALFQPTTTILNIMIAVLSFTRESTNPWFTCCVLGCLVIALIGDINNKNMADMKTVIRGLIIFVFAYLGYGIMLSYFNGFHREDVFAGGVILIVYLVYLKVIWKTLGEMKPAVIIYGFIMFFLVSRGISTVFGSYFSSLQKVLLVLGPTFLLMGDIEFSVHLFKKPLTRLYGPFFYGCGQMMIALSCSFFPE